MSAFSNAFPKLTKIHFVQESGKWFTGNSSVNHLALGLYVNSMYTTKQHSRVSCLAENGRAAFSVGVQLISAEAEQPITETIKGVLERNVSAFCKSERLAVQES